MNDLRDKIAEHLRKQYVPLTMAQSLKDADTVIALIRENVPPLVFEERRNDYWGHKSHPYQVALNSGDMWRVRLHGRVICKQIKGRDAAIAWANEHHVNAVLKEAGLA